MSLSGKMHDLALAFPYPSCSATFKQAPEDFQVVEELGFEPSGHGEHVFLFIRKRNLTTERLVDDVARAFGIKARDVGFCGLKDKHAVTEQWLSVPFPIKQDIPSIAGESWEVLRAIRHERKLKRGIHKANHFVIRLGNLRGDVHDLESRLQQVAEQGFPNYFGQQRFGRDGANISKAEAVFAGQLRCSPFQKSIYYSAARSWLFNQYLSWRVANKSWNQAIPGDCFNLDGSQALFGPEPLTEDIARRIAMMDIHPVGVLPGEGDCRLGDEALAGLQHVLDACPVLYQGLVKAKVKTDWRPLRARTKSLNWKIAGDSCELHFSLPTGSFATALVRELVIIDEEIW